MTATTEDYDEFSGASGLIDDYDGTIKEAYFSTDANYNNGQTLCLHLVIETDDPSNPEVVNLYPCGPDWASYDDGATTEHPRGEKQKFNSNTKVQKLITAAIACSPDSEAELRRRSRELFDGVGHRHADLWKGLRFHWNIKTEDVDFTDKLGNRVQRQTNVLLPTTFLGVESSTTQSPSTPANSAPTAAAAATASAPPTPAASTNGTSTGADPLSTLDPETVAKLKLFAKTQTYAEFVDSALEIPGLPGNTAVVSVLGDEKFYEALKA